MGLKFCGARPPVCWVLERLSSNTKPPWPSRRTFSKVAATISERRDYFGNGITYLTVTEPHDDSGCTTGGYAIRGIVFFVSAGQPQGSNSHPAASAWWSACLITGLFVLVLFGVGRRFTGSAKALTFGAAAGLGYGLQAAVTKTFVTELGGGVLGLLSSWSVYVLVVSAVTGFALQQSSLKTGVLAPAMASSNSVTLFSSVILGITVYGETLSKTGTSHSAFTVVGLVVAIVGIAFLAGSEAPQEASPRAPDPSPAT